MGTSINIIDKMKERHKVLYCCYCEQMLDTEEFYSSASRNCMFRCDSKGKTKMLICKSCSATYFTYLKQLYGQNQRALFNFCSSMDIYYDEDIYNNLKSVSSDTVLDKYMTAIKSSICTFADTIAKDNKKNNKLEKITDTVIPDDENTLNEEDLKNRREILTVFHGDPFEGEKVKDKKRLYRNLCTMCDVAMVDDVGKQQAAIQLVRGYLNIEKYDQQIKELSSDTQSTVTNAKEIKTLSDIKAKEWATISMLSKDQGFSERYASSKAKGTGTLSATIRDMEEYNYDDGKVNLYDIQTSASIQQVADINMRSIDKQLALTQADYIDMLKVQRDKITELNDELRKAKEEARLAYKQITKEEILKELVTELKNKGIAPDEITNAVVSQIHYSDEEIKAMKKDILKEQIEEKLNLKKKKENREGKEEDNIEKVPQSEEPIL